MKNVMVALVAATFATVALAQGTTAAPAAKAATAAPAVQAAPADEAVRVAQAGPEPSVHAVHDSPEPPAA